MTIKFSRIGIIGKYNKPEVQNLATALVAFLQQQGLSVIIETQLAGQLSPTPKKVEQLNSIAQHCDLIVLIGGDGSLLNAARAVVDEGIPVVGINCGRRGFLTDLSAQDLPHHYH
jgi:NAD+ kinase